jgi:putative ABC transport system substrate-binding protein
MSRRLVCLAWAFGFAGGIALFGALPAHSTEAAQNIVRLGVIWPGSSSATSPDVRPFYERLRELGYIEGQNLVVESRWAENQMDRLPQLTAELLARDVDVLVTHSTLGAIAAKRATSTIPIVAAWMGDPVGSALAVSLAHPGGNLTGLSSGWGPQLATKWLELLKETAPHLATVAVIANPDQPVHRNMIKELDALLPGSGVKRRLVDVRNPEDLDHAFERAQRGAQAILLMADPMIINYRTRVVMLAAKSRLPVIYGLRDFADAGGLMAYGPDIAYQFRRTADYVDRILKGAKPADLPIEEPTQYRLVVNLKTAKVLGLRLPESILSRADEVLR